MIEIKGKYNTAKVFTNIVDDSAISQLIELCNQKWVEGNQIRIMPDVHAGAGCVIGTSMTINDKICPNLIGVDIGCGMLTVELGNKDINFEELDKFIRINIPAGMCSNEKIQQEFDLKRLKCYSHLKNVEHFEKSLGSLGGGNHFLEVDQDDKGNKYLIIHSGSRNLGKQVALYYQDLAVTSLAPKSRYKDEAKKLIEKLKNENKHYLIQEETKKLKMKLEEENPKVPVHLAYLEGPQLDDYLHDMKICQEYAVLNRKIMAEKIIYYLDGKNFKKGCKSITDNYKSFETIHNYIDLEDMILRKGSVNARQGRKLLIPINMRDGCIIGIGKGNFDYNYTAPHGAGRLMSRSAAKEAISLDEFKASMKGIFTTSVDLSTIDESPMAYKPIEEIISNIEETVEIVDIIKPIYNFKASDLE